MPPGLFTTWKVPMPAALERPAFVTRPDGSRAPSPDYIADLLALESKLESVLSIGKFEAPPSLIARVLKRSTQATLKSLTEKDRRRFSAMLADVKKAIAEFAG
jgi:hypothetical protein